jgi:hypothetical protein
MAFGRQVQLELAVLVLDPGAVPVAFPDVVPAVFLGGMRALLLDVVVDR